MNDMLIEEEYKVYKVLYIVYKDPQLPAAVLVIQVYLNLKYVLIYQ